MTSSSYSFMKGLQGGMDLSLASYFLLSALSWLGRYGHLADRLEVEGAKPQVSAPLSDIRFFGSPPAKKPSNCINKGVPVQSFAFSFSAFSSRYCAVVPPIFTAKRYCWGLNKSHYRGCISGNCVCDTYTFRRDSRK